MSVYAERRSEPATVKLNFAAALNKILVLVFQNTSDASIARCEKKYLSNLQILFCAGLCMYMNLTEHFIKQS
jgi:hypothetical protein